jgi:dihydrofolate reductase
MIVGLVAVDQKQGIGFDNSMPWPQLIDDLKWFKKRTDNNVVLMGSKTWKSIGKPLPGRINVVISSQLYTNADLTLSDPVEAITELSERYRNKDICIIGGQAVFDSVKHLIDVFYITEIEATYECDRQFDLEYVTRKFKNVSELEHIDATETTPAYTIKEYKK